MLPGPAQGKDPHEALVLLCVDEYAAIPLWVLPPSLGCCQESPIELSLPSHPLSYGALPLIWVPRAGALLQRLLLAKILSVLLNLLRSSCGFNSCKMLVARFLGCLHFPSPEAMSTERKGKIQEAACMLYLVRYPAPLIKQRSLQALHKVPSLHSSHSFLPWWPHKLSAESNPTGLRVTVVKQPFLWPTASVSLGFHNTNPKVVWLNSPNTSQKPKHHHVGE